MLLLAAGPAMAVPFAVVTALPALGELAARIGVGRLPEETATPEHLLELALPAIKSASRPPLAASV
jgi:membrane glycosyltransferase